MRALYASEPDFAAVDLLQRGICALVNQHMHPWDVAIYGKERRRVLKRLLRAQAALLGLDCWLECVDGLTL